MSTALILLSDLDTQPSAQEMQNELRHNIFTSHGKSIYMYSPPNDSANMNGRVRIYRLTDPQRSPTG